MEEHLALGTPAAITSDASRGFVKDDAPVETGEFSPPGSTDSAVAMLREAQFPDAAVQGALKWVAEGDSRPAAELAALDEQHMVETEQELRFLWGNQFDEKLQALHAYVAKLDPEIAHVILNARDPATGRAYVNSPDTLVRLAGLASRPMPERTSGADEIAAIERLMREDRQAYNKNEQLQARYRFLLSKRG